MSSQSPQQIPQSSAGNTHRRAGTQPNPICRVSDLPPGERRIVEVRSRSIGVFNVHGEYYALRSLCPHQGAPLCRGAITGTARSTAPGEIIWEREGQILRCPWHGWEFDIATGRSVFNPHRLRVRTYDVTVDVTVEQPEPEEEDPSVESFDVTVEDGWVVLHA
ncbi:MAG: Rieske (2Fe-2S) protein [Caldilineaceae bacterium SB0661_bin_32]|uniref:Rieske (2Fe-2S) protein n=1 Tax=Caldilineaceae bacterium SB0661_bin_32 TaxID=2605255 RepID=A0A6B1D9H4_9CHLR|nr:Rieske (2Fe-2S) protein [Caldilineaceae bacterium SB0661_bin_32]